MKIPLKTPPSQAHVCIQMQSAEMHPMFNPHELNAEDIARAHTLFYAAFEIMLRFWSIESMGICTERVDATQPHGGNSNGKF